MWQVLEKEQVSASSNPIRVQFARDLGILLIGAVVVHREENVASEHPYVLKKHNTILSKKWQKHAVNKVCSVAGTVYFTLQKRQM